MKRKMTVVFHDENLYTELKIQAVRRHIAASNIVADAVREWIESHEDAKLLPVITKARAESKKKGSRPWSEVERELAASIDSKEKTT